MKCCVDSIKSWLPPQAPEGKLRAVVHLVKHAQKRLWATYAATVQIPQACHYMAEPIGKTRAEKKKDNSILFGDEVVIKPEGNYFATTPGVIE